VHKACASGTDSTCIAADKLAADADLVVVAVSIQTSEGMDRKNLSLPWWQEQLLTSVLAVNPTIGKKTLVVARTSGAFAMPWLSKVSGLILQLMPGQAGGTAAAMAILGKINPEGKLPISMVPSIDSTWLGTPLNPAQYPGVPKGYKHAVQPSSAVSNIECKDVPPPSQLYQRAAYSEEMLVGPAYL